MRGLVKLVVHVAKGELKRVLARSELEHDFRLAAAEVHVLLVPVGGGSTLDPTHAVEVISAFEPKIVIPMHYRHPGLTDSLAESLEPVEKFMKEFGAGAPDPQEMLKVTKSNLPEETQLILLKPMQ